MNYSATDNIIVCSSGHIANVAISKIRLSGKINLTSLNKFFSKDLNKLSARYTHYLNILDDSKIIDDVICVIFKAPHSYTGEDLIELDVHGNVLNVKLIIELFINKAGFRLADPGEFSYRALRNKKLTLSQVEGLDLVLNANSIYSLDQGRSLISGKIHNDFEDLYQSFLTHKSAVELGIDFFEDVGEEQAQILLKQSLARLKSCVQKLAKHISNNSNSILGPQISLLGEPNAGKSTFFNMLLEEERSIVSNIAGTTRDYVSESIFFENILFKLVDTAGIRESSDQIEAIGVERSIQMATESFVNILVVNPFVFTLENYSKITAGKIDLIVFTHLDQEAYPERLLEITVLLNHIFGPIEPLQNFGPIEPDFFEKSGPIEPIKNGPMGAKNKSIKYIEVGLNETVEINNFIQFIVAKYKFLVEKEPFLVSRHSETIKRLENLVNVYSDLASKEFDISIISFELSVVGNCISELIGIVSPDDVLRNIFTNFCIGK